MVSQASLWKLSVVFLLAQRVFGSVNLPEGQYKVVTKVTSTKDCFPIATCMVHRDVKGDLQVFSDGKGSLLVTDCGTPNIEGCSNGVTTMTSIKVTQTAAAPTTTTQVSAGSGSSTTTQSTGTAGAGSSVASNSRNVPLLGAGLILGLSLFSTVGLAGHSSKHHFGVAVLVVLSVMILVGASTLPAGFVGSWVIAYNTESSLTVEVAPDGTFTSTVTGLHSASLDGTIRKASRRLAGAVPSSYVEEVAEDSFWSEIDGKLQLNDMSVGGKEVHGVYPLTLLAQDGKHLGISTWRQGFTNASMRTLPRVCLQHADGTDMGLAALGGNKVILRYFSGTCANGFRADRATAYCRQGVACPQDADSLSRHLQVVSGSATLTGSSILVALALQFLAKDVM